MAEEFDMAQVMADLTQSFADSDDTGLKVALFGEYQNMMNGDDPMAAITGMVDLVAGESGFVRDSKTVVNKLNSAAKQVQEWQEAMANMEDKEEADDQDMGDMADEEKEVDFIMEGFEKPACAADWDIEAIKENLKEDMMKEKEDMMKEQEDAEEEGSSEEKPGLRSYGGYKGYRGYYRRRRAADDEDKPSNKDPECFESIKEDVKEFKEDMDKDFPNADDFEKPACVEEQDIDISMFKVEMTKMKKQCAEEEDKEACVANMMPEDFSEEKKACLDEVQEMFAGIKDMKEMEKEVDSMLDNFEKPACAADWSDEDIKENFKEDMMKEDENMMNEGAEKDKRWWGYGAYGGYSGYVYGRRRRAAEEGEKLADKDSACWQGIKDDIKDFKDDMDKQFPSTDKVEAPACVDTEEIDLNQFKIDMMNMKKQCKASMEENADKDKEEAGMR